MHVSNLVIQLVGFAAMALMIASYQMKSNRLLFIVQSMGLIAFGIQFLLMNQLSASIRLVLCLVRNVILVKYNDWAWVRWKGLMWVFCAGFTLIAALTWTGPICILPWLGTVSGTIGYMTNNAQKIRLATLVCSSPSWLLYDLIVGSWGGFINESITLLSIIISIKRYGWKNMGDPDSEFQKG